MPQKPILAVNENEDLQVQIFIFQQQATELFVGYHFSKLQTCNWHTLDPTSDDLMVVGDMHGIHGGLYGWAQQIFKELYSLTN